MAKKRTNQYWIDRSNEVLADIHKGSDKYITYINRAYDKAIKDIQKDIRHIFITYQAGHNLGATEARMILNTKMPNFLRGIIKRIYPTLKDGKIKDWMLAELNAQAYKARITRLEALKKSVQIHYMSAADKEITLSKSAYVKSIKESYYRTTFSLQKGIDIGFNVAQIPQKAVEVMLNTNWSGKLYDKRIWSNSKVVREKIANTLTSGFISGKSVEKMVKEIEGLTEFGKFAAERLVRTECTYFANQGSMASYRECEVEKYIFVATLDLRTSKECRKHDTKSRKNPYKVSEAEVGKNLPPMHVFCRSTTRAYLGEKFMRNVRRRARDPDTGKTYLVGNMGYEEWYNKYVK